ncbi:g10969 [Coccomyxa elongata]
MGTNYKELSGSDEPHTPRRPGPNYNLLVPLIYAPLLPLIRIGLKKRVAPATRDKIFGAAVLTALAHAGYVMSSDSTM